MGYKLPTICRMLREEGLIANWMEIHQFLQKHRETNNIERRTGSGRPTKMTVAVKALVERQMRDDNETTTVQLHVLLLCHGHAMTLKAVLRCHTALGWTFRGQCLLPVDSPAEWSEASPVGTGTSQRRSSSNSARIVLHQFIQRQIVLWSF